MGGGGGGAGSRPVSDGELITWVVIRIKSLFVHVLCMVWWGKLISVLLTFADDKELMLKRCNIL